MKFYIHSSVDTGLIMMLKFSEFWWRIFSWYSSTLPCKPIVTLQNQCIQLLFGFSLFDCNKNSISEAIYWHFGNAIKAISSFLIVLLFLSVLSKIWQRIKSIHVYPFFLLFFFFHSEQIEHYKLGFWSPSDSF